MIKFSLSLCFATFSYRSSGSSRSEKALVRRAYSGFLKAAKSGDFTYPHCLFRQRHADMTGASPLAGLGENSLGWGRNLSLCRSSEKRPPRRPPAQMLLKTPYSPASQLGPHGDYGHKPPHIASSPNNHHRTSPQAASLEPKSSRHLFHYANSQKSEWPMQALIRCPKQERRHEPAGQWPGRQGSWKQAWRIVVSFSSGHETLDRVFDHKGEPTTTCSIGKFETIRASPPIEGSVPLSRGSLETVKPAVFPLPFRLVYHPTAACQEAHLVLICY